MPALNSMSEHASIAKSRSVSKQACLKRGNHPPGRVGVEGGGVLCQTVDVGEIHTGITIGHLLIQDTTGQEDVVLEGTAHQRETMIVGAIEALHAELVTGMWTVGEGERCWTEEEAVVVAEVQKGTVSADGRHDRDQGVPHAVLLDQLLRTAFLPNLHRLRQV
mmetsp:Transcript_37672/g.62464  ORF Transcript_37672/g.62464 Transcript_37672/m.62464 type:complete len:163 (+) Transcript_37672:586-1074(+)